MTRRDFAALVAALPLAANADDKPEDPTSAQADALLALIKARFGKSLSAAQLKSVRGTILGNIYYAQSLKKLNLTNGHEPATIYPVDPS